MAVTALLAIASMAVAQSAGSPSFVPIAVTEPRRSSVIVEPGDHLWKISEEHLTTVLGRPAEDAEIDPYWRTVIEANLRHLESGDPDLIFPGERVTLPPTG